MGRVAQLGEHLVCNQGVGGSNPPASTTVFFAIALLTVCAALGGAPAAQAPPPPVEPERFLARDSHEQVTIAARPLLDALETERVFGKNAALGRAGLLPVEILIFNERAEAVRVGLGRIVVVTGADKFEQIDPTRAAWAMYPPPSSQKAKGGHIPRPAEDKNRTKREEVEAALRVRQLRAAVVGPGGQARGYLYFTLEGAALEPAAASVYIPEVVALPGEEALLFFEISLKPYAR